MRLNSRLQDKYRAGCTWACGCFSVHRQSDVLPKSRTPENEYPAAKFPAPPELNKVPARQASGFAFVHHCFPLKKPVRAFYPKVPYRFLSWFICSVVNHVYSTIFYEKMQKSIRFFYRYMPFAVTVHLFTVLINHHFLHRYKLPSLSLQPIDNLQGGFFGALEDIVH